MGSSCRSPAFPPTALIHGTGDTAALPEDSQFIFDRLGSLGVPAELSLVPEAPHGFDVGATNEVRSVETRWWLWLKFLM